MFLLFILRIFSSFLASIEIIDSRIDLMLVYSSILLCPFSAKWILSRLTSILLPIVIWCIICLLIKICWCWLSFLIYSRFVKKVLLIAFSVWWPIEIVLCTWKEVFLIMVPPTPLLALLINEIPWPVLLLHTTCFCFLIHQLYSYLANYSVICNCPILLFEG